MAVRVNGCIVRPLRLPYETRDFRGFSRLVETRKADCGGLEVIAFVEEGLRKRLIVCRAPVIGVESVEKLVSDELSGLRHVVRVPVLRVGDCRIVLRWSRSRFVLHGSDLLGCNLCREEPL